MVTDAVVTGAGLVGASGVMLGTWRLWRWGRSNRAQVQLVETARDAWDEQMPSEATLCVSVDPDRTVTADADKLHALFAELFDNAATYGWEGVTVRVVRTDDGFAVADDGPGIPPEQRDDVRELGFTTRPNHDGIGLALAESIAESNDWRLSITDSDEGGTRIEFSGVTFSEGWRDEQETAPE